MTVRSTLALNKATIAPAPALVHQPRIWLFEKTVLVGLITVIFAEMLPGLEAAPIQTVIAVALMIVVNSLVSHWLALQGADWQSTLTEFAVMSGVNLGIAILTFFLLPFSDGDVGILGL